MYNRGYVGYSMSVRAEEAYDNGEMPLSKWTKGTILSAIERETEVSPDRFKRLSVKTLKENFLYRSSWHHTSRMYNRTDFYSLDVTLVESITDKEIEDLYLEERKPSPIEKKEPTEYRAECEYLMWGGTRKHPKSRTVSDKGTIRGSWFYADNGDKKSINGNGFRILTIL